jgi:nitronate monooxygenase
VLDKYLIPGGKGPDEPYRLTPIPQQHFTPALTELTVLANFAEVYLAKEGHAGMVGVNHLEKLQTPTLPSLFGAMLAGVDYVLMGAGIPRFIPGALDLLATGRAVELNFDVAGAQAGETFTCGFDPAGFCGGTAPVLRRPQFLAIVSSVVLGVTLTRKASGRVDGFVIEGATAGGHNAPPRGPLQLSPSGEPVYGPRDEVDLAAFRALERPFWLAGGYATPERLADALAAGAAGIQVGTAFAFCAESSIDPALKARVIALSLAGSAAVFTDPLASPTGFPFKVMQVPGTLSESEVYGQRPRLCDLGYLRQAYRREDGSVGYRCPAEPVAAYVAKGGSAANTIGRKCICNALFATIKLGQIQAAGGAERALVTAGDDVAQLGRFLKPGQEAYTATDVVAYLLGNGPRGKDRLVLEGRTI